MLILQKVDANSDERITVDETIAHLKKSDMAQMESQRYDPSHRELFFKFKAQDTVAYHDTNDDMEVSRQEVWDSLAQWNVVAIRMKEGLKLLNKADRAGLESFERSFDYMRRQPATIATKLRPELEALFSLPKGTKILNSMRGVNSLSDTEWFSRTRDRVFGLAQQHGHKQRDEM